MKYTEEQEALRNLLTSHPNWGKKAVSISQCLRSRAIEKHLKIAYIAIMESRYPDSKFDFPKIK